MEENEVKQENSVNTEELKNETMDTVKQVKETIKNVDVKEEAKATKGFVLEMIKNPLDKIKEIANDSTNKYFKTAIVLVIIWAVVALLGVISFKTFSFSLLGSTLLRYVKIILAPVATVIAMSLVIFLMNKKSKKSLVTVLTTVTATELPVIVADVISLLTIFSYNAVSITSRISGLCSVISTVLLYFAIRELYNEENEKTVLKNFVIIQALYIVLSLVISYLGIYI